MRVGAGRRSDVAPIEQQGDDTSGLIPFIDDVFAFAFGDPADYPYGHGPQGDVIRIFNHVRCVRTVTETSEAETPTAASPRCWASSRRTG